ncbi:Isochorismatase hydrolase [Microthyrium microscopicum]|uniref:Isochorismatase hydrolase n=1 Tax=Microthyrium microscopicum TaxID=703497 RepID=A0A6A6TZU5_9PEZI|nr:Isochorismatase hydrolase [Microthyrium microscopicum]
MASATSFREIIGVSPSSASPTDSTLIIIDAQNEYAEGKLQVSNVASSRKAIADLLQKYRDAKGDIVHVVHSVPDGAPVFTPNTNLAEEFDELKPKNGEKVIKKNHPGSFADTDLQKHLESTGKKKLVLTGYMAHVCVSTTARQAAQRGYDVIVAEDAVGDRDIPGVKAQELTTVALREIADAFGTIVSSKEIA